MTCESIAMRSILFNSWLFSLILGTAAGASSPQELAAMAARGKQALETGDYDRARRELDAGLGAAREQGDTLAEARFLFYNGLTDQVAGEAGGDHAALRRAVGSYRRALALKPDSGSAMVNLGQVLERLGKTEPAEEYFRRAIRLDDDRLPAYEKSYAEFLERQGRPRNAVAVYRRLALRDPQDGAARAALLDYYLAPGAAWSGLKSYLWELVRRGDVGRSLDLALESLGDRRAPAERQDLLSVIAVSLGRQFSSPESFLESSTAEFLWGFAEAADVGAGVEQLFNVYGALALSEGEPEEIRRRYREMDLSWWQRGDPRRDPEIGLRPRDALRRLLRSFGDWYARRERPAVAAVCYETAADFTEQELGAAALTDLVDLYARRGEIDKIEQLAVKYESRLADRQGEGASTSQLEEVYRYRRVLGQVYGHMAEDTGDWGSREQASSAIFQLERAVEIGRELDRSRPAGVPAEGPREFRLDPGLVDRLATAYEATEPAGVGKERADRLRIEAAERYTSTGDDRARTYVLEGVDRTQLAPSEKRVYDRLSEPRAELLVEEVPDRVRREERPATNSLQVRDESITIPGDEMAVIQRHLKALLDQRRGAPKTQWQTMGAPGRLLKLDARRGMLRLEIDQTEVEIRFDRKALKQPG